jgi:hypothetical protein
LEGRKIRHKAEQINREMNKEKGKEVKKDED